MSDRPTPNQFDARVKAVFRHRTVARDLVPGIWIWLGRPETNRTRPGSRP